MQVPVVAIEVRLVVIVKPVEPQHRVAFVPISHHSFRVRLLDGILAVAVVLYYTFP
jgi:hypothetical protein